MFPNEVCVDVVCFSGDTLTTHNVLGRVVVAAAAAVVGVVVVVGCGGGAETGEIRLFISPFVTDRVVVPLVVIAAIAAVFPTRVPPLVDTVPPSIVGIAVSASILGTIPVLATAAGVPVVFTVAAFATVPMAAAAASAAAAAAASAATLVGVR